jgi:uncharacterized Fe-S cluster protein YjdI
MIMHRSVIRTTFQVCKVIIYGSNLIFDHRLQKGQSEVANPLRCPRSSPVEVPSDEGKDINNKCRYGALTFNSR